jgi:hypothetical protein
MAGLIVTKVVREVTPLELAHMGTSIGAAIDERLRHAVMYGEEIASIQLDLSPDDWRRVADSVPERRA